MRATRFPGIGLALMFAALPTAGAADAPQTPRPTPQPYFPSPAQPDRAAHFIANTIENLRGLDPTLSCRTLTLADGRRPGRNTQPPPPPIQRDARVQVWLLNADGTQVLPASYDCRKDGDLVHITYAFDAAEVGAVAAAAVRVSGDYVIEALQPSAGSTAAP